MLINTLELGSTGEQHVAAALAALGYSCQHHQLPSPDCADLMATGPASLLIRVRTSLYPADPAELTGEERRDMASRAAREGCQAWFAKLRLNSIGAPVGEIIWGRITNSGLG